MYKKRQLAKTLICLVYGISSKTDHVDTMSYRELINTIRSLNELLSISSKSKKIKNFK